jgi:hypothetical protein
MIFCGCFNEHPHQPHSKSIICITVQKTFVTKCPCCEERILSIPGNAVRNVDGYTLVDLSMHDLMNLERQITFEIARAKHSEN